MGDVDPGAPASGESLVKYHPGYSGNLTCTRDPGEGHCLAGSLTGAVASQTVTEALKGHLSVNGNHASSARIYGGLTARHTGRAGAKAGPSDPAVPNGRAVAQRIKGTPGITG